MLLASLRDEVLHANREIARRGLAPHTFGNASGIDRSGPEPLVVIKPSGVDYASLTTADLVVTNLDGRIVEGSLRPSSDLDTHTLLYRDGVKTVPAKAPYDDGASIADIGLFDFLRGERFGDRNRAVKVVGVGGAEARDRTARLRPGGGELGMGVNDAADLRELAVEQGQS